MNFLNTTLRNVHWFKDRHDKGELEMKPPFQRNPVWATRQKSYLIDSILNGYPIPEVYMQDLINDRGNAEYIIVDGQQRIRSVLEFIEGEFDIDSKDSPTWGNMFFDDLSGEDKIKFYEYNFVVRILPRMADSEIRSIFQRLNKNVVSLNKQELRQATYCGPFIAQMNKISDWNVWKKIGTFSANDIRRMLDVEFISELSVAHIYGLQNKKQKLDKYYQLFEEEFDYEENIDDIFSIVLPEIARIIPEISKTRWRKKSDFYSLFLYFAEHCDELPLSKDKRDLTRDILTTFAERINYFTKSDPEKEYEFDKPTRTYGSGASGGTTDLGSRRKRAEGLDMALRGMWTEDLEDVLP